MTLDEVARATYYRLPRRVPWDRTTEHVRRIYREDARAAVLFLADDIEALMASADSDWTVCQTLAALIAEARSGG